MSKIEVGSLDSLDLLKKDSYMGFSNRVYRFVVDIPLEYVQRKEPGPLMAFNVNHKDFYEVLLAAKRSFLNYIYGDRANVTVEVAEAYISLAFRDLKKVQNSFLIVNDEE